jgi:PKD domain-containing protein
MRAAHFNVFESLESRRLMTAVHLPQLINDPDIAGDSNVQGNGTINDYLGDLQLPAGSDAAGSAFYGSLVPISRFSTGVEFGPADPPSSDQYLDFVIQSGPTTALGGQGIDAGYGGGTMPSHSVAVIINEDGDGSTASMAFATGGNTPLNYTPMTGINLTNSGLYTIDINYHAGRLNFTLINEGDSTNTFSATDMIDLPSVIGGQNAYVGFAGSSGDANIDGSESPFIRNWTYGALEAPNFSTPAAATVPTGGTTATLSAGASTSDDSGITYSWTDLTKPKGAADPLFSDASSADTTAIFSKAGTYHLRVSATGDDGISSVSDVSIHVAPMATVLKVTPHAQRIIEGASVHFTGTIDDQFGHPLAVQPDFQYVVTQGSGMINASTGLFTAGKKTGHLVITTSGGGLSGFSGDTII